MSAVAVAVGVAGAAASYAASASSSSSASKSAASAQKQQKKQFEETKRVLTEGRDEARKGLQPYANTGRSALDTLSTQMGLPGDYSNPIVSHQGQTDDPLWNALIAKYNPGNIGIGTWSKTSRYQQAVKEYQAAKQAQREGDPNFGALTKTFGAEQYRNDPGYTPMVNSLEELQATPGYKFQLEQGLQSVNNSAAARGSLLSGGQLKAINNYAQGVASTGYQAAWERAQQAYSNAFSRDTTNKNNTFNRLQSMANNGQQAASQQGNYSMQVGNALANASTNFGASSANLSQAQGSAAGNQAIGANNAVQGFLGWGMTPKYNGGGGWGDSARISNGYGNGGGYVNEAAIGNKIQNWWGG